MSDRVDQGEKNDESSTNVDASFSCADCGQEFKSRIKRAREQSALIFYVLILFARN
jgi:predicted RNA-binding Zn-ribbon protein involved in translation (DUF1610 family)